MAAVSELATEVGTRAACRALVAAERDTVLAHLHGERFQDRSPAAVYVDVAR